MTFDSNPPFASPLINFFMVMSYLTLWRSWEFNGFGSEPLPIWKLNPHKGKNVPGKTSEFELTSLQKRSPETVCNNTSNAFVHSSGQNSTFYVGLYLCDEALLQSSYKINSPIWFKIVNIKLNFIIIVIQN